MQRRTLDILVSIGGAGLVILLLVGAVVLRGESNFSSNYVKEQLSQQKIKFTTADKLTDADKAVDTGPDFLHDQVRGTGPDFR